MIEDTASSFDRRGFSRTASPAFCADEVLGLNTAHVAGTEPRYTPRVTQELEGEERSPNAPGADSRKAESLDPSTANERSPALSAAEADPPTSAPPSAFEAPVAMNLARTSEPEAQPPVSEEELEYQATRDAVRAPPTPKKTNTTALLALSAMGLVWMANTHDTVGSFVALMIALIVNQLGHSFAMRGFGYRDRSVFFVPFFGSIATGQKEDATPTQRALVLLFGPLPGIVAASVLAFTMARGLAQGSFIHTLTFTTLVLNLFQLLPFPIFTGGQLAQQLLFRRHRVADSAFRTLLGVGLLYASIRWELWVLGIFAALSLLRVPNEWRIRKAADTIRARFGVISPRANELSEEVLRAVHDHAAVLAMRFAAPQRPQMRIDIAKEIIRLASEESPDVGSSMAILSVTGVLFVVGMIALISLGR